MSLSRRLEPGTRLLLLLNQDDESITEAVAMWPVSEGDWILLAPGGELAICDVDHVAFAESFTVDYPLYDDAKASGSGRRAVSAIKREWGRRALSVCF